MTDLLWLGAKLSCVLLVLGVTLLLGRRRSASWECTVLRVGFWTLALLPVASLWGPRWLWRVKPVTSQDLLQMVGAAPTQPTSFPVAIVAVYGAGVFFGLAKLAWELARLRRELRACVPFPSASRFPILASERIESPFTAGVLRPVIVLPSVAAEWSSERLRSVLAHEEAHVGRSDWVQFIAMRAVRILFWPNLLLRWLDRSAHLACEQACDDEVLGQGVSGPDYARHLVSLAQPRERMRLPIAAMAAPCALEERVRGLLISARDRGRTSAQGRALTTSVAFAVLLGLGGLTLAPAAVVRFTDPIAATASGKPLPLRRTPTKVIIFGSPGNVTFSRNMLRLYRFSR